MPHEGGNEMVPTDVAEIHVIRLLPIRTPAFTELLLALHLGGSLSGASADYFIHA